MTIKKIILPIVFCFIFVFLLCYFGFKYFFLFSHMTYDAKVEEIINGDNLILSNGEIVDMAGIVILTEGPNFRKELIDNINKLIGERVTIKVLLKQGEKDRYPKYPLVIVYSKDGTNINEKLLKEGMTFFDHGYYREKDKYEKLQEEAKINRCGIWKDKEKLVVKYIGSKKWWDIHYPECPEVKKIKEKDKIEYYFELPRIFYFRGPVPDCPYCEKK